MLQAKKEEAWEAAKRAGEGADKRSDRGYLDATKAVGRHIGADICITCKCQISLSQYHLELLCPSVSTSCFRVLMCTHSLQVPTPSWQRT